MNTPSPADPVEAEIVKELKLRFLPPIFIDWFTWEVAGPEDKISRAWVKTSLNTKDTEMCVAFVHGDYEALLAAVRAIPLPAVPAASEPEGDSMNISDAEMREACEFTSKKLAEICKGSYWEAAANQVVAQYEAAASEDADAEWLEDKAPLIAKALQFYLESHYVSPNVVPYQDWPKRLIDIARRLRTQQPEVSDRESDQQKMMATFGQRMFDMVESVCATHEFNDDPRPIAERSVADLTDNYISAWSKLKRENEELHARLRTVPATPAPALALREALESIASSPHCQYSTERSQSEGARQYKIGVADGHRCAAQMARDALAATRGEQQ